MISRDFKGDQRYLEPSTITTARYAHGTAASVTMNAKRTKRVDRYLPRALIATLQPINPDTEKNRGRIESARFMDSISRLDGGCILIRLSDYG